jgi:hypothetical protein
MVTQAGLLVWKQVDTGREERSYRNLGVGGALGASNEGSIEFHKVSFEGEDKGEGEGEGRGEDNLGEGEAEGEGTFTTPQTTFSHRTTPRYPALHRVAPRCTVLPQIIPIEEIRSVDIRKRTGPVTSFAIVAGEYAYLLTSPRGRDLRPAVEQLQVRRPRVYR